MKKKQYQKKSTLSDSLMFRIFIFSISFVLLYFIWVNRKDFENFSQYGYFGLFVVNFISAATILLPAPGTATVFLGGALWNPLVVGLVSGGGSAIGELFAYFLGFGGRGFIKTDERKSDWVKKLEERFNKSGFLTTFIFSALPIPVFDIIGLIAGAFNYPVWKFLLAASLGRILRNILYAFTGARLLN